MFRVLIGVGLVLALLVGVWMTGVFRPALSITAATGDVQAGRVTLVADVVNRGWFEERVPQVTTENRGITIHSSSSPDGIDSPQQGQLVIEAAVDCRVAKADEGAPTSDQDGPALGSAEAARLVARRARVAAHHVRLRDI